MRLLVGLQNPGPEYQDTRHNAGAWVCEHILQRAGVFAHSEKKFQGLFARVSEWKGVIPPNSGSSFNAEAQRLAVSEPKKFAASEPKKFATSEPKKFAASEPKKFATSEPLTLRDEWGVLLPMTFMNLSGQAVQPCMQFYKIPLDQVWVIHDELDLPPGVIRVKQGGGHAGHNGLRDIMQRVGPQFWRIRIGIGHPGAAAQVSHYVLSRPSQADKVLIDQAIERVLMVLPELLSGETARVSKAIQYLHSSV
jgi:PTH1 family peptidyl-tRNA hydrolase